VRPTEYKWVALTVTTVGAFMAALDSSIVVVGLPTVLKDVNATLVHGIWIVTGYRLMLTILLVAIGRVADMLGRVRLYNVGFAVFTLGSALCGVSQSGEQLVAFRFIQGLGGALLAVNSVAIVTDAFPPDELGKGIGINFAAFNFGSVVGYTVSGVMIGLFGWRSLFLVNVPIGVFGTLWSYKRLSETRGRRLEEKFDYPGAILYASGLSVILFALTVGDPVSPLNSMLLVAGVSLLVIFAQVERRSEQPVLDPALFKIRVFTAGNISSLLNSLAFNALPFILTLYFQLVRFYEPLTTGLLLIPMEVAVLLVGPLSGRLSDKYGARGLCSLGLLLNSGALFWFSRLSPGSPQGVILSGLLLAGIGRGLFGSPNASSIMGSVPAERRGVANGVRTTLINTASSASLPLTLVLMTLGMPYERLSQLTGGDQLAGAAEQSAFLAALQSALLLLGLITALAIIPSLLRGPRRGVGGTRRAEP